MIDTNTQVNTNKPQVTLTIPSWILAVFKIVDYGAKAVVDAGETVGEAVKETGEKVRKNPFKSVKLPNFKSPFSKFRGLTFKRKAPIFLIIVFVAIGLIAWRVAGNDKGFVQGASQQTSADRKVVEINKSFEIPIKTQEGEETGEKMKVTINRIEKVKEILIQNNQATAKNGKTFLLITMDIENPTKKRLTVKPIDMVRLIGTDGRSLAADVHNNEVSSEPVSLKSTRIGYVVDENLNSFKFLIGEVRGTQEPIEVTF